MGKAIILEDCDFSQLNLGQVTFVDDTELQSLEISGESSAIREEEQYEVVYNPTYTTQRRVAWSIESGSQYATIDQNGLLTILQGADNNNVTIKVESLDKPTISATKNITVTYVRLTDNLITVTATKNQIIASAQNNVASDVTITLTGDLTDTLIIQNGTNTAIKNIQVSQTERTCSLNISPMSDMTYKYILDSDTIIIPNEIIFMIVGPSEIIGDVRAGNYHILDMSTMKQVVGTNAEVTDDYKEYIGQINWSITRGQNNVTLEFASGTDGNINIISGSDVDCQITALVDGNTINKSVIATYNASDLVINTFAELQAFANGINQKQESTVIPSCTNGDGYVGKHIRLNTDIDFGTSAIKIGKLNSPTNDVNNIYFKGWFDGAGYKLYNVNNYVASTENYCSALFAATFGGSKISNFTISGTVVFPSKSSHAIVALAFGGTTTLERIYNEMVLSGGAVYVGAFAGVCADSSVQGYTNFIDCVFAGSINANRNAYWSTGGGNKVWRNAMLGEMISLGQGSEPRARALTMLEKGVTTEDYCASDNLVIGKIVSPLVTNSTAEILYVAKGGLKIRRTLACGEMQGTKKAYFFAKNTYYFTDSQANYYDNNLTFADNSDGGKSLNEIKSGSLFDDSNWIEVENFIPIINNQFAVRNMVLNRAKNGYVS